MAPMAAAITDGKKNQLAFFPGFGKSFGAPWKPIDRIMCVLEQIRTAFLCEPVGSQFFSIVGPRFLVTLSGRGGPCNQSRRQDHSGQRERSKARSAHEELLVR